MYTSNINNKSFHFNSFLAKSEKIEEMFDIEEKNPNASFNPNTGMFPFYYSGDIQEEPLQLPKENEINDNYMNLNLSQFQNSRKDQIFDKSYNSYEQNLNENSSHMIIEEEFEKENCNNYMKIGKDEEQNAGIEPIIEMDSFEEGPNDSFFHENNYFIHKFNDISSMSLGENNFTNNNVTNNNFTNNNFNNNVISGNNNILNMTVSNDNKFDFILEDENELFKIKKNLISLKLSKNCSLSHNNSKTNESSYNNNKSVINDCKKIFNVIKQGDELFSSSNINLNMSSCCLSSKQKRGRKKLLLNGIKTEIIDKTFIREFKKYLKKKQKEFRHIFDEDAIFWKEFFSNGTPPFNFTVCGEKKEFKSYNKNLLKFIFGRPSTNKLYSIFVNENKDIIFNILSKRVKKMNYQTLLFYKFYGQNMHKLYSDEYSLNDINIDDLNINNVSADQLNMTFQ